MEDIQIDSFLDLDQQDASLHLPAGHDFSQSIADQSVTNICRQFRARPRNPRSCDFCRARKTACVLENGPPCTTCKARGKQCQFTGRRSRRDRQNATTRTTFEISPGSGPGPEGSEPAQHHPARDEAMDPSGHGQLFLVEPPTPPHLAASGGVFAGLGNFEEENMQGASDPSEGEFSFGGAGASSADSFEGGPAQVLRTDDESLDLRTSSTTFLLGETGEADPYLLRHPNLAAHAENIEFRHIHREHPPDGGDSLLDNERPLVLMLGSHSLYSNYEPRVDDSVLDDVRRKLDDISTEVGVRLIKLFFRYVYPYFPVLSRTRMLRDDACLCEAVSALPLSLKAAVFASALPFMVYDDVLSTTLDVDRPSSQSLYRYAWTAITHEIHTPHLSTLQACLLLLQRDNNVSRYVQGSPFQWSLVAWTVGLAQTLGLPTDCSTWRGVPAWEKRLRRRLWWATYVLDKWVLLCSGLATHIRSEDFDVRPLDSADFVSDVDTGASPNDAPYALSPSHENSHFYHLVCLTGILSDVNDTFFSVRATRVMAGDLKRSIEAAKPLRTRLRFWKESYDRFMSVEPLRSLSRASLDSNISLGLAYPVVNMLLFRALLRPLDSSAGSVGDRQVRESSRPSIRKGAEACCLEIVECIERIQLPAWNGFWHKFSPNFFAMASSFMMRLIITSTTQEESNNLNELIDRWKWAMRTGGGNAGNAMMSLALLRLDRTLLKSGLSGYNGAT